MIHVKIDLVPFGQEEGRKTISDLFICNEGDGGGGWHMYGVYKKDPRFKRESLATVPHRREEGCDKLVALALTALTDDDDGPEAA